MMRLKLRVHPAGAAWLGACFLMAPSHAVLAAVAALTWHEAAHVAAMALCGVKHCVVELTPFGGMADAACYERLSPGKKAASSLAGVLASAVGAWLCFRFAPDTPFWHAPHRPDTAPRTAAKGSHAPATRHTAPARPWKGPAHRPDPSARAGPGAPRPAVRRRPAAPARRPAATRAAD